MNKIFSNPSYPLMINTTNNSFNYFSNSLNDSSFEDFNNAEELYNAYFRDSDKKTKNSKDNNKIK